MAVAIFKNPLGSGDFYGINRRRVFVPTETGCVLGMELDRSDNAHTLERRLQVAINFPVEDGSLTFGDMVLKNNLSAIRNDSPLLLTRNMIHRSSSTPCLSPTSRGVQHRDQSGPIEVLGHPTRFEPAKQLVKKIVKAIKNGVDPIPVHSGLGGAYFFRNSRGECVAIVKPTDEEPHAPNNPKGHVGKSLGQPGLKCSVRVGETGFREVAAYLLDSDQFANVPPTALVKITHSIFNVNDGVNGNKCQNKNLVTKTASLQQFIPHDFDANDIGAPNFRVSDVHRIGIFDIRILNTDRHAGNLLVRLLDDVGRFGQVELIPIDHGLCLPETLENPYFEWIHWPQSSMPFSDDELEYIKNLDPVRDSEMLQSELPMIREACLRVLVLCTNFLKEAAAYGLCLAEIGEMMSREFRSSEEEPSELEVICIEAMRLTTEDTYSEEFQSDINCEADGYDSTPKFSSEIFMSGTPFHSGFGTVNGRTPLPKLEESIEEESEGKDEELEFISAPIIAKNLSILNLPTSLKNIIPGEEKQKFPLFSGPQLDHGYLGSSSSSHRSTNEQVPPSVGAPIIAKNPSIPKLSTSLKNIILPEKKQMFPLFTEPQLDHCYLGSSSSSHRNANEPDHGYLGSSSSSHRSAKEPDHVDLGSSSSSHGSANEHGDLGSSSSSHGSANEQGPPSVICVKLADMDNNEWELFLEKFHELLHPAFAKWKSITLGPKQRQRLGTSLPVLR